MTPQEEIEELKQAYKKSPENFTILKMLIRKMKDFPEYAIELEQLVSVYLKKDPRNIEFKEILIQAYFDQDKISTCIVIAEEIGNYRKLSVDTRIILAKCFLREGDKGEAKSIYANLVNQYSDIADEELDRAFRLPVSHSEEDLEDELFFSKPDIDFSHVGGMDNVKREIDLKIIKPLENAELYKTYGKKIGGGILLYGPPGCGKTYIAKATAGQIKANFISIKLNDILDMWIGESEKNLHNYFELARENTPCVVFIDEVDALGAKRSDMRQSAGKNVINQFLDELDGISSENEGLLIIGATNVPWHLDPAFRRPGRFDRIIFVPPPDLESREAILKIKLAGKPIKDINYKKIAKHIKDFSGADINAMIDIAIEGILEKAIETNIASPITTLDLLNAVKQHKASTIDWFVTAKNYAMFANQAGLYDDILKYLKK
jgi:SpoVK/Ycf46/Vps4 family AAA+-type ATPase